MPAVKTSSRSGTTRRPLERILRIHERINRGRHPNCSKIAQELETSRKTIQRDINFMRDELDLPIDYDETRHGYYYTRPVSDFPFLQTTAEDLVALIVARNALVNLGDTPLVASLRNSFQRMQQGMNDRVSIPWSDVDQAFSVRTSGVTKRDVAAFEKISRAILEQLELHFDYTKLDEKKPQRRHLQAYHLSEIDGGWYVIGHDLDRGARRTFAVQRMKGLSISRKKFVRPDDFCMDEHFAGSFGAWTVSDDGPGGSGASVAAKKMHRVRIRLSGFAARFVPERRWHPSQQVTLLDKAGDTIELQLELSALEDIRRWVLSFGCQAEVLAPKELRQQVRDELATAVGYYD